MSTSDKRPPTRLKRFSKLAKMTASVAGTYTKAKLGSIFEDEQGRAKALSQAHSANGEVMAQTLGQLKGAVMKVGQMASVAEDILPKEMADALGKLQKDSPPMSYDVIAEQIASELGDAPERLFDAFDTAPFAAASIGQVHRAVFDGREVVVKVQYPGVDESCDSDLNHLRRTLRMSGFVNSRHHKRALDTMFEEIRLRIHEELDYCIEADHVRRFQELHARDPWVVIPEVVGERSAQRVLTMTYEPGDHLDVLRTDAYDQDTRNLIGERLIWMFGHQIFEHKLLHADPNPGNYAFRENGDVVLYDFGCVKEIEPKLASMYRDMADAMAAGNYVRVDRMLELMGARNPDAKAPADAFYAEWRDVLLAPFLEHETFDYATATVSEDATSSSRVSDALKHMNTFQPAADLVFIDRVVVGMYHNLCTFDPVVPWRALFKEFMEIPQIDYDD